MGSVSDHQVPVRFCKSPLPWPEEKRQQAGHAVCTGQRCSGGPDVESAGLIRLHCPKRRLQSVKKGWLCAFYAPQHRENAVLVALKGVVHTFVWTPPVLQQLNTRNK